MAVAMVGSSWKSFVVRGKSPAKSLTLTQVALAAKKVHDQQLKNRHFKAVPPALQVLGKGTSDLGSTRWDILFPWFCCRVVVVEGLPTYQEFVEHDCLKASVENGVYLLVSYVAIDDPLESSVKLAHQLATTLGGELER